MLKENRSRQVNFRLTEREFVDLKAKADEAGITVSTFCQHLATGAKIKKPSFTPEQGRKLLSDLGHIGGNINQIARGVNESGNIKAETLAEIRSELSLIWDFIVDGKVPKSKTNQKEKLPDKTENKICPKCGQKMLVRKGQHGSFWGCTSFPNCRYTEPIE